MSANTWELSYEIPLTKNHQCDIIKNIAIKKQIEILYCIVEFNREVLCEHLQKELYHKCPYT